MVWGNLNYNYGQATEGYQHGLGFLHRGIHSVRGFTKPHLVTYMESHDEERITYKNLTSGASSGSYNIRDTATALKRMELGAAFLLTIPGPKMIWQFGELGYDYPINYCTNGTINNNCRLDPEPIRWDYLNDNRRKSVFNTYSRLMALRNHTWYKNAFLSGTIDRNLAGDLKWIKVNSGDTSQLIVVGNFGVTGVTGSVTFPAAGTWFDYFSDATFSATGNSQIIGLLPGEFHVYVNRNVNNVSVTPVPDVPWNGSRLQAKVYPNPANNQFSIKLQMPAGSMVNIDMYNSTGQFIRHIHSGFLTRGEHELILDRKGLSRGNYFMRLNAGVTQTLQITFQ